MAVRAAQAELLVDVLFKSIGRSEKLGLELAVAVQAAVFLAETEQGETQQARQGQGQ
ncbi:MAG: hypothetical protein NTV82_12720 [Candidatus Aminicenantes bacterium]|nr:hypothetical protein [Candidatus Aminicenantes bacterium]